MATSELKEILFALDDLRKGNLLDGDEYQHGQSIFRKANPCILNFPVIVSDLISLEDLNMINKALEREYASVVRLAMGLDDIIGGTNSRANNKIDYIKQFHTNDYTSTERDIRSVFESANIENLEESDKEIIESYDKNKLVCESLGLNMKNLNDSTLISEARGSRSNKNNFTNMVNTSNSHNRVTDSYNTTNIYDNSPSVIKMNGYDKQLLDNDVKKANELIPTTLDITVYQNIEGANGSKVVEDHILLGIKTVAHKVDSDTMISNIKDCLIQKRAFFRFIQWTTGEIKFFKDYLLCLDTLKKEALETRSKDRSTVNWFRSLKNKSTIAKIKQALHLKDTLIPNSTIVITMDEVDYLRNNYNIDLFKDVATVYKLMKAYFLIGFVIVDASSEIAYFMFDGFKNYQTYSFRALERENRNQGNDLKALVSLMSGRF